MSKSVRPIIETLFASAEPARQPVKFSWRLIRRKGRPFMLLPESLTAARAGLSLYSAQRWQAKLWRATLPWILHTPAARFLESVHFEADTGATIMQFIAQQAGAAGNGASLSAIKLSEVGKRSRLVLLLCDESGRPTRVIKVGLNAAGQADTNREADCLEKLPPNIIGCIRMTGRINRPTIAAFATDYFPGDCPRDDAGMEHLFNVWLNPGPPAPLESLPLWRELDATAAQTAPDTWSTVKDALAGKAIRTTLYHGDFAPWNVRVVNSQNLQAFDWERGQSHGIPGWDWFHFTIQTSILAKRCSTERVAAEVEQLIYSERFKKYAAAAGISDIVEPLVLAYLLHHRWVIKPMEGSRDTLSLFTFLSAHWLRSVAVAAPDKASSQRNAGWLATAGQQLKSVVDQWCNLFWEPTLNSAIRPTFTALFRAHWPVVLLTALLVTATAMVQFHSSMHLMFLPFYMVACALITWKIDRRWGVLTGMVAAVIGPIMLGFRDTGFRQSEILVWNTVMRFLILYMSVLFTDRIAQQKNFFRRRTNGNHRQPSLADSWAVVCTCIATLIVVAGLDYVTDPRLIFLPLYLFPCMMLTLVLNLRWGIVATLLATTSSGWIEYITNKLSNYTFTEVFVWNFLMRALVSVLVLGLLDRIRKENILFSQQPTNGD